MEQHGQLKTGMNRIYTLGTGTRIEEDFIEILHAYDIRALADVRSFPKSRNPWCRREHLENLLSREGIAYYFLGVQLGGFRKGGYAAYTVSNEFSSGITALEGIARSRITVVICAEHFPWKCHRRWISRELHNRGWETAHIIEKGKLWIPK